MKRKKRRDRLMNVLFVLGILVIIAAGRNKIGEESTKREEAHQFVVLEENAEVSVLYVDGQNVYVGTDSGLHIYREDTLALEESIDDLSLIYSAAIVKTSDGGIWVGHEKGLTYLNALGKRRDYVYPNIPQGRVNTVAADKNTLWCGTYNGAARLIYENGCWEPETVWGKEQGLISGSVNVILPVRDGLLFGSYMDTDGGITFISKDGSIRQIGKKDGLPHTYVTSMLEWDGATVLVGTGYMRDGALVVLKKRGKTYEVAGSYSVKDGLPGEKIRCLYQDRNSLWITTEYDGVIVFQKKPDDSGEIVRSAYLTENSGLSDNEIKCIAKSSRYYWLGGKYGLTLIPVDYVEDMK